MLALWTRMMVWFDRDERGQGTVEYILVVLAVGGCRHRVGAVGP